MVNKLDSRERCNISYSNILFFFFLNHIQPTIQEVKYVKFRFTLITRYISKSSRLRFTKGRYEREEGRGEMLVDGLTFGWINTEDGEKVALHARDVWKRENSLIKI